MNTCYFNMIVLKKPIPTPPPQKKTQNDKKAFYFTFFYLHQKYHQQNPHKTDQ